MLRTLLIISALFCLSDAVAQNRLFFQHRIALAYYPVSGENTSELISSMSTRGPLGVDGKRYYAYTLWQLRIGNRKGRQINKIVKRHDLKCRVSVHMPKLMQVSAKKQPDLEKKWAFYYQKMLEHENQHVKHAFRACAALITSKASQARLERYASRLQSRDSNLDLISQHGKLTGVTF